ncbi:MAG: relaxase/mobilization nuclease domain-containing protein [Bacteroidales bacterium]
MIATVSSSRSISSTLNYNENNMKGGEIIYSSGIDPSMNVDNQIRFLEAMSNPKFKVKAHTIVISHGDNDTKKITIQDEKKILKEFLLELEKRGVNLDAAPWVIARHNNTNNTHYHMAIMNTCYDGSKFNSAFLGKTATRAAAKVSLSLGLEAAPKAANNIRRRKEKKPTNEKIKMDENTESTLHKVYINRQDAIEAARLRKEKEEYEKKLQAQEKQRKSTQQESVPKRNRRGTEPDKRKSRGFGR